ncbi:MAG TPA: nucleoside triphosphate pyrophosphohydrolase [Steroidobacteraceae bacterium]|nr:nucleoside triphosphate pyrophosphohydrolase [Steroidobacteraceae bacterium]
MTDAEGATRALLELMARLRDPERGCPWDLAQTFKTIAPYTIEEAYEVAEAIDRGEPTQLRDELGDLLFQVVFHARMAQERGWFDFAAVATAIRDKLVRRHPHVFAADGSPASRETTAQGVLQTWEDQKALERATKGDESALADVPHALPGLTRAAKLGKRAARVGFDWSDAGQVREKVAEELAEVDAALAAASQPNAPEVVEELGDLLFALTNWSLHLKIDAEQALRAANAKFERRFRRMEALAREQGQALSTLTFGQWESLWRQAKRSEARQGG